MIRHSPANWCGLKINLLYPKLCVLGWVSVIEGCTKKAGFLSSSPGHSSHSGVERDRLGGKTLIFTLVLLET